MWGDGLSGNGSRILLAVNLAEFEAESEDGSYDAAGGVEDHGVDGGKSLECGGDDSY